MHCVKCCAVFSSLLLKRTNVLKPFWTVDLPQQALPSQKLLLSRRGFKTSFSTPFCPHTIILIDTKNDVLKNDTKNSSMFEFFFCRFSQDIKRRFPHTRSFEMTFFKTSLFFIAKNDRLYTA